MPGNNFFKKIISWMVNNENLTLIVLVLIAFVLRILGATISNLWFDETYSWNTSRLSIDPLFQKILYKDVHPPTYYLVLHFWMELFGDSVFALRSLSIIPGALSIVFIYKTTKRISTLYIALLAAFLVTISAYNLYYSTEVRMYSWLNLFIVCTLYYFVKLADSGFSDTKTRWLLALSVIAGIYTHLSFALFAAGIGAAWIYFYLIPHTEREVKKQILQSLYLIIPLLVICCVPWFIFAYFHQFPQVSEQTWREPFSFHGLVWQNTNFLLKNSIGSVPFPSLIELGDLFNEKSYILLAIKIIAFPINIAASFVLFYYVIKKRNAKSFSVFMSFITVIILTACIFIITGYNYYLDRYLFFISSVFIILLSVGLGNIPNKILRLVLTGIIIISFLYGTVDYLQRNQRDSDHRPAIKLISEQHNVPVVLSPFSIKHIYKYYLRNYNYNQLTDKSPFYKSDYMWLVLDYRSGYFHDYKEALINNSNYEVVFIKDFETVKLLFLKKKKDHLNPLSAIPSKNILY